MLLNRRIPTLCLARRWNKMKKRGKFLMSGTVALGALSTWGWHHFFNETEVEAWEPVMLDVAFVQPMELMVMPPSLFLKGQNVFLLTVEEQRALIESELAAMAQRSVVATYEMGEVATTLEALGLSLGTDLDEILASIDDLKDQMRSGDAFGRFLPKFFELPLVLEDERVDAWVQAVAQYFYTPAINPRLSKTTAGQFIVNQGQDGQRVLMDQLRHEVEDVLSQLVEPELVVQVERVVTTPAFDASTLGSVDTRINGATTYFSMADWGRAQNVKRGAELINSEVIMPGEVFSFNALVYPVTWANGYRYGTIFLNGQEAQGIGGGLCQVSSTLYWAWLRAGLTTVARQAHSRPVFYLPRGLDATMWTLGEFPIDPQFRNDFDYPVYLHASATNGNLTIEFWSADEATGGRTFEPWATRTRRTDTHKYYDTFLRTYQKGQLLSETFLHTSRYIY